MTAWRPSEEDGTGLGSHSCGAKAINATGTEPRKSAEGCAVGRETHHECGDVAAGRASMVRMRSVCSVETARQWAAAVRSSF